MKNILCFIIIIMLKHLVIVYQAEPIGGQFFRVHQPVLHSDAAGVRYRLLPPAHPSNTAAEMSAIVCQGKKQRMKTGNNKVNTRTQSC